MVTTYVLKPRPPVRAFALSAVLSLAGAGLLAAASGQGWGTGWVAASALLLAVGLAFGAAGALGNVGVGSAVSLMGPPSRSR